MVTTLKSILPVLLVCLGRGQEGVKTVVSAVGAVSPVIQPMNHSGGTLTAWNDGLSPCTGASPLYDLGQLASPS